ncbi:signaling protein [Mangrovimonas sp. DI 80]|nr:signaling protein [Mangrovimonas sp. DI 80]
MRIQWVFIWCFLALSINLHAQGNFNMPSQDNSKVKFQLINNLIIIPVEVNGVELSFLLDSGVSKPILFNIFNLTDSLHIYNGERIYLRGLGGDGEIEALKSSHNKFKIGDAVNVDQDVYVVFDNSINFTPRLGVSVHGIIGYDVFKDFIVEINYGAKYLKLHKTETYSYKKCNNCETLDLILYKNKPYVDALVCIDSAEIPVKLLVDTGSSDALWLFEDTTQQLLPSSDNFFEDFLGKGLSGNIHGKRSKVKSFSLSGFDLKRVNVAFPDSVAITEARNFTERNGSISGELLKRFNIVLDYHNFKMTIKKNGNFKKPFHYNKSGIVLEQNGVRIVKEEESLFNYAKEGDDKNASNRIMLNTIYKFALKPAYTIVELREDSPAYKAGLLVGDVILSINNKGTHTMTLQELTQRFCDDDETNIKLVVDRAGNSMVFKFRLESLLN